MAHYGSRRFTNDKVTVLLVVIILYYILSTYNFYNAMIYNWHISC